MTAQSDGTEQMGPNRPIAAKQLRRIRGPTGRWAWRLAQIRWIYFSAAAFTFSKRPLIWEVITLVPIARFVEPPKPVTCSVEVRFK